MAGDPGSRSDDPKHVTQCPHETTQHVEARWGLAVAFEYDLTVCVCCYGPALADAPGPWTAPRCTLCRVES